MPGQFDFKRSISKKGQSILVPEGLSAPTSEKAKRIRRLATKAVAEHNDAITDKYLEWSPEMMAKAFHLYYQDMAAWNSAPAKKKRAAKARAARAAAKRAILKAGGHTKPLPRAKAQTGPNIELICKEFQVHVCRYKSAVELARAKIPHIPFPWEPGQWEDFVHQCRQNEVDLKPEGKARPNATATARAAKLAALEANTPATRSRPKRRPAPAKRKQAAKKKKLRIEQRQPSIYGACNCGETVTESKFFCDQCDRKMHQDCRGL